MVCPAIMVDLRSIAHVALTLWPRLQIGVTQVSGREQLAGPALRFNAIDGLFWPLNSRNRTGGNGTEDTADNYTVGSPVGNSDAVNSDRQEIVVIKSDRIIEPSAFDKVMIPTASGDADDGAPMDRILFFLGFAQEGKTVLRLIAMVDDNRNHSSGK